MHPVKILVMALGTARAAPWKPKISCLKYPASMKLSYRQNRNHPPDSRHQNQLPSWRSQLKSIVRAPVGNVVEHRIGAWQSTLLTGAVDMNSGSTGSLIAGTFWGAVKTVIQLGNHRSYFSS